MESYERASRNIVTNARAVTRACTSAVTVARDCRQVGNCALLVRANNLHSGEAAAAVPGVEEPYQCQTEAQSGGGR
jgi:hypothetical protein